MLSTCLFYNIIIVLTTSAVSLVQFGSAMDEDLFASGSNLVYEDCRENTTVISLEYLQLKPKRFSISQNISLSTTFKVLREISAPIRIHVNIWKKVAVVGYLRIPCVGNYGSCISKNICDIYENEAQDSLAYGFLCPKWFRATGIKCRCPLKKGSYSVKDVQVRVGVPQTPKWIAKGDYKARLTIEDRDRTLGCFKFVFRLT